MTFVRVSLLEYTRAADSDCMISPRVVVTKMLYREWGSAGDAFTSLLTKAGITARVLDDLVDECWRNMIRLPSPGVFRFVTLDENVRDAVVKFVNGRRPSITKGLRV